MTTTAPPREPWPDRLIRPPRSSELQLGLRNLYILPSRFGWLWLLACAVLYLMGTRSGSNGPLLLAYGGLGLFLLSPFLTQFNLQGLTLQCGEPSPGFAGEPALYPLRVTSPSARQQLQARFRGQPEGWSGDLLPGSTVMALPWQPRQRGLQRPGRLRLQSQAPLGMFVCWTLWEPPQPQLIYPARRRGLIQRLPLQGSRAGMQERQGAMRGDQSWRDLTPHRPEEGLSRLAWKQLARSGQRLSKQFSDAGDAGVWLSPDPGLPWEQALEHLCQECLVLAGRGQPFGLVLAGERIEPGGGERQLRRCLSALALAPRA